MKLTGEQFNPEISSKRLAEEHYGRYDFAKNFCFGKKVLDIACGYGYGSYELAKHAESVVGVDLSNEVIEHAKKKYHTPNLNFVNGNATDELFNDEEFDVVVSFETIEHLSEDDRHQFYRLIHKYLKKNGMFIISTPNKLVTSPYSEKPLNSFHIIEFYISNLVEEVSAYYKIKKIYGQRFIPNYLLFRPIRIIVRIIEKMFKRNFELYSNFFSAEVSVWNSKNKNPRIIVITATK
jgi:2-polyprenyl-3-methyl-5-hydroxy-6-metoxy-1,4-benzoquinol methylase